MSETSASIMDYSQDLSDAVAPVPLPVGEYPATLVHAEPKTSPTSGNRYLALRFRIDPESYPADHVDGNPDGELLNYNRLVLQDTPAGRWRARKFIEALGLKPSRGIDINEIMGATCSVHVAHGAFEGETRAEISRLATA